MKKLITESIDPRRLLVEVAEALDKLRIPYVVTGGMAVFVWARPRFTADIDIVIRLKPQDINKLATTLSKFSEASYIDTHMMERALNRRGEFNFIDGASGIKVDFWVLGDAPYDKSQLQRRVARKILDKEVYFISSEERSDFEQTSLVSARRII